MTEILQTCETNVSLFCRKLASVPGCCVSRERASLVCHSIAWSISFIVILSFVSHLLLQKHMCCLHFHNFYCSRLQALKLVRQMLTVGWASYQVSWGQSALQLQDNSVRKDWALAANCIVCSCWSDENTQPLAGVLTDVYKINKLHCQSIHDDTPKSWVRRSKCIPTQPWILPCVSHK